MAVLMLHGKTGAWNCGMHKDVKLTEYTGKA